ncbi:MULTISPECIES: hypothetical protein [Amycolatopsis]|uniref:Uncharacterized protein n=1 Tax=Amycolatopsis bullii TaxID=941987 RepID=A0ABQ3KLP5_9PSEU|nr:hypothetical protein [Amycolatopsis bullii]GHG27461.1 hypothetical protein GCM10017567_53630 [Amycolatopsis bullii]
MPRRRPGTLRRLRRLDVAGPPPAKIPYLSRREQRQLAFAEVDAGLVPGAVAGALRRWQNRTRPPIRLSLPDCPCPACDPLQDRLELAEMLSALPRRERALIGAELAKADGRYRAQTLPDPFGTSPWWFACRLIDQNGWGRL